MDEQGRPLQPLGPPLEESQDYDLEIAQLLDELERQGRQGHEALGQAGLTQEDVPADAIHHSSAPTSDRNLAPINIQESHQDGAFIPNLSSPETEDNPRERWIEQIELLLESPTRIDVLGDQIRVQLQTEERGERINTSPVGLDEELALRDFRALVDSQEQPRRPDVESNRDSNQQQRQRRHQRQQKQQQEDFSSGQSRPDSAPLSIQDMIMATTANAISPFYKPVSIVQNTEQARQGQSRERGAHAAPQRFDTPPKDTEERQLQIGSVPAKFELEDVSNTRIASLSQSNVDVTTAAILPSLEPRRRPDPTDRDTQLRTGTDIVNQQEQDEEDVEPGETTLAIYNFYLIERTYSVRDYINSRLAPIANSCLSKGATNRQFCRAHKMLISLDKDEEEKNQFQLYTEASFNAAVLKSCTTRSILREMESELPQDQDVDALRSQQIVSRKCPLIDLVREIPKCFCCSSTVGGVQIFFDTLRSKGMTALADEAQHLFDEFSEHRITQIAQPPNIPHESVAHFLIHSLTEGAYLVCSIKAMIAASECGTVEQYITCCQALQEFVDLFICAGWALQAKQKLLPIQVFTTPNLDCPAAI